MWIRCVCTCFPGRRGILQYSTEKNVNLVTIFQNLNQQKIANWVVYHMAYRHTLLTKVHSRFGFRLCNQTQVQFLTFFTSFTKKAIKNHKFLILKVESSASENSNIKCGKQQQRDSSWNGCELAKLLGT